MVKNLKRSTVELIRAILFALCALSWLPDWPLGPVSWLRIVLLVICAAISVFSLACYFKSRKAER
ncbi:MAG: hypothetical protein K1W21_16715 [Oscillospiraceae bacterium]|jgi:hypothetical protein